MLVKFGALTVTNDAQPEMATPPAAPTVTRDGKEADVIAELLKFMNPDVTRLVSVIDVRAEQPLNVNCPHDVSALKFIEPSEVQFGNPKPPAPVVASAVRFTVVNAALPDNRTEPAEVTADRFRVTNDEHPVKNALPEIVSKAVTVSVVNELSLVKSKSAVSVNEEAENDTNAVQSLKKIPPPADVKLLAVNDGRLSSDPKFRPPAIAPRAAAPTTEVRVVMTLALRSCSPVQPVMVNVVIALPLQSSVCSDAPQGDTSSGSITHCEHCIF